MTPPTDRLERWEYLPAAALFVAAGLNTALWYASPVLPKEAWPVVPWVTMVIGIVAILAIDGSLIATIGGMRQGRRNPWSVANIVVTAIFTALAAWAAHGVMADIAPWLHGMFAATIVTYSMHLAQPRADVGIALALRSQELDNREADLTAREQTQTIEYIRVASAELTWPQFEKIVNRAMTGKAASMSSLRRLVAGVESEAE